MNTTSAVLLLVGLFAVIFTLSVPIGIYMSAVFDALAEIPLDVPGGVHFSLASREIRP